MEKINLKWHGEMAFSTDIEGEHLRFDAAEEHGGKGKGARPKPFVLAALAGCTAMDVASMLRKMKVELEDFNITVEAEMSNEHPKIYHKIHLIYEFKGKDLPLAKLEKAINLSQDQYCGVNAMLKKAAEISYEIKLI